ncbi:MAG: hypothetical protein XD58_0220 [Thermotoga sp. 50_1627]|nr:MAG: hypothetical protein XD45_0460 [Thermotoga sp. 50_64]KUK25783.1 MAG: hypothetical protein XD58_0220 [Thermotoga sp. 50_1627]MDK2922856.1 hypothetical protein [Pseudothermotoga sp.]
MPARKLLWFRAGQVQNQAFLHPAGKIEVEQDDMVKKFVQQNIFQHTLRSQHFKRLAHDDSFRIDRTDHVGPASETVKIFQRFAFDYHNVEVWFHVKKIADSEEFFKPGSQKAADEELIYPPDSHRPSQRGAQKDQNERRDPACTSNTLAPEATGRFHPR